MGLAGGSCVPDTVRAVMKRLMTSAVAKQVNWKGKGGKVSFSSLSLRSVVCGKSLAALQLFYSYIVFPRHLNAQP